MAQRPPRNAGLNIHQPYSFFLEKEVDLSGLSIDSATILLTNKECPWRCLMCDLWKNTTVRSVPLRAIPEQIAFALKNFPIGPAQLKLYNSGSFFDSAAIPVADYTEIAKLVESARHVIVESHPRLVGQKTLFFRNLLSPSLEVAIGLETIHPRVLPLLNKRFDLGHFQAATHFLAAEGIAIRAFILVNPPFLNEKEGIDWAVRSAEFAFSCGAAVVSLIPTRAGNGAMERLQETGEFTPPGIPNLEQAFERALDLKAGRVFADIWDIDKMPGCQVCREQRTQRLQAMNLAQTCLPAIRCSACSPA